MARPCPHFKGKTHNGGAAWLVAQANVRPLEKMKRHGNLYNRITDPENIRLAYRQAKRNKPRSAGMKRFDVDMERNLERIRASLLNKTFTTSKYLEKILYEPKQRTIYILPFAPDRIVQHALMNVLIPIWQAMFIKDSYACILGRGIHTGSARTMDFVRRNRYCLKCDISKFYPSVDHEILKGIIRRKVKCPDTLWLIEDIVNSYPGGKNVPIGNFTSQWMGNLYMNELDQYVKQTLKIKDYIRYCDDFLLFHNDKAVLREAAQAVTVFTGDALKLRLSKCDLFPTSRGVDFLGYRHFSDYILLRKSTAKRVARRLRAMPGRLERGKVTAERCRSVLASAKGWLQWASTHNFRRAIRLDELTEFIDGQCRRHAETATL
jgi:retron-type reverse transcriptase